MAWTAETKRGLDTPRSEMGNGEKREREREKCGQRKIERDREVQRERDGERGK